MITRYGTVTRVGVGTGLVHVTLDGQDVTMPAPKNHVIVVGDEYPQIERAIQPLMAAARTNPGLSRPRLDYEPTSPRLLVELDREKAAQLGVSAHELGDKQFYTGIGCDVCGKTGYRGRRGLYELLNITDPIRDLITAKAPTVVIKQKAIELGMNTLREDGLRNIYLGHTTIEEVLKYT